MRYEGIDCPDCGEAFTENSDVVVCPACGTPQHRACWQRRGACVNAEKHGDAFAWINPKPAQAAEIQPRQEEKPPINCPVCGSSNPSGTPKCRNCGQRFTMFGVNLLDKKNELDAEEEREKQKKQETSDADRREADKSVSAESNTIVSGESPERESAVPPVSGEYQDGSTGAAGEKIDGVLRDDISEFVRVRQLEYVNKFQRLSGKKKLSWNWAAFVFGPYWFFFRKLVKPGIVFLTATFCCSLLFMQPLNEFLIKYQSIIGDATTYSEITEPMVIATQTLLADYAVYFAIYAAVTLIIRIVGAVLADYLYKRHAFACIKAARENTVTAEFHLALLRTGGVSAFLPVAAYAATYALSYLVDYITSR